MLSGEGKVVIEMFMGALSTLIAILFGWFMWDKKRSRESIDDHAERITKLETEMITKDDARILVMESLDPLKEDMRELKESIKDMSEVMTEIRLELASRNGYLDALDTRSKD